MTYTLKYDKPLIGKVQGLFATNLGIGGITRIESFKIYNKSKSFDLELTGKLGDVMKESGSVAKTLIWNLINTKIQTQIKKESSFSIHIHCPEGAQPKDGPSAGTALTISIFSLLTNLPISNEYAITGEIDFNYSLLPIGGLESKLEGAKRAGIYKVIIPKLNTEQLDIIKSKNNSLFLKQFYCLSGR